MAADYSRRLANMRARRKGEDGNLVKFAEASAVRTFDSLFGRDTREGYEKRSTTPSVQYAFGSMAAVNPEYTAVSVEEGERVKAQLLRGLGNAGIPILFEYQGSVPLNIHIRRHSDIDLLVLHGGMLTHDPMPSNSNWYTTLPKSVIQYMLELRSACEDTLQTVYWGANVDISGAKSISLSGGSFQRKVDVVPSHWHDTYEYRLNGQKHDREVKVLDKSTCTMLANRPFLHMKRIDDKDKATVGGAKKAIRLLKTLKADSDQEIKLSSYDIASLVWHFNDLELAKPATKELALVAVAQVELNAMCRNYVATSSLMTPDGSRAIIDEARKFTSLQKLAAEVDALAADLAREIDPMSVLLPDRVRPALEGAFIAA